MSESSELQQRFEEELDELPWANLVHHFAYGRVYLVREDLDIIDAALAMAQNNVKSIRAWLDDGRFGAPEDREVKVWTAEKARFQILVVSPFVLIKKVRTSAHDS